ncbi:MAG: rhodanese-like domain-containing protein [Bacteroidota bacterium]|jgi:rhodanese-related sulfurtransferase
MMNRLKQILLFTLFIGCNLQKNSGAQEISPRDFSDRLNKLQGAILLDVRSPEEYAEGHLKNARNINWNDDGFKNTCKQLDKKKTVFVYCLKGGRSASAADYLRKSGFTNVYELQGGIEAWEKEKLPLSKD